MSRSGFILERTWKDIERYPPPDCVPVEVLMNDDPADWTIAILIDGEWSDVYRSVIIDDPVTQWRRCVS